MRAPSQSQAELQPLSLHQYVTHKIDNEGDMTIPTAHAFPPGHSIRETRHHIENRLTDGHYP